MKNDLTYRQLRIVDAKDAKHSRARTVFVVIGAMLAAWAFWLLVMGFIFWYVFFVNTPCAVCGR